MSVTFLAALWVGLGVATLVLAIYRKVLSTHNENDVVHLSAGEEKEIPRQVVLARKMGSIDRWGKTMTVLTVVIGLGLATAYLYQAWESPNPGPIISTATIRLLSKGAAAFTDGHENLLGSSSSPTESGI
jgi:hypothetical protein